MARVTFVLAFACIAAALLLLPGALAARPLDAQAGRDLLQSCTITKCSRCRNERLSSFTPTEVCVTCDAGWTPASSRLSCGEFRVACVLIERASAL